jgi:sugar transferase (PEP-CTERM system associated)
MIRLFRHYIPVPVAVLGLLEALLILVLGEAAWQLRWWMIGRDAGEIGSRIAELMTFTAITWTALLAVGFYQNECYRSRRMSTTRLLVGLGFSVIALTVIFFLFPDVVIWRSVFVASTALVFIGLTITRIIFIRYIGGRLRRRILVLGAGQRAAFISTVEADPKSDFTVVRFVQMAEGETAVENAIARSAVGSIAEIAQAERVDEVVLALDERRGSLPVGSLLEAKLKGFRISELSTFLERETGRVDLAALNPSWLIFSDGFWAARSVAVITKRTLDISASVILLVATSPILLITAALIKLTSPGPVFYRQERTGLFGAPFEVLKFRSMRTDAEKDGKPQWAQAGDSRVTPVGRFIRSTRIDEIPQIFNVLKGDMSFVGPRPERPFFVEQLAREIPYFNERHVVKPGLTGWAQLNYPYGASVEDARHKLEYDLYYVKNYSLFLDLLIIVQTVRVVLWQDGVR